MDLSTENYCKKLGHHVTLSYCITDPETGAGRKLCPHIRDCWFQRMDIDSFLSENFGEEEIAVLGSISGTRPLSKMETLYDLIKRAQERSEDS